MNIARLVVGLLLGGVVGVNPSGSAEHTLQYKFKPDEKLVYQVDIEADFSDATQHFSGLSFYEVKGVNTVNGHADLSNYGHFSLQEVGNTHGPAGFSHRGIGHTPLPGARSDLSIDAQGKLVGGKVNSLLPFLLGDLAQIAIIPLPDGKQDSWEISTQDQVIQQQSSAIILPHHIIQRQAVQQTGHAATKTDHYSITATGSNVTVHVTDSLITSDAAEKGPLFKLTGEGDVTFDSEAGCVKDVNMKYKLEVNRDQEHGEFPLFLTAKLLDEDQAKKAIADRNAQIAMHQTAATRPATAKPGAPGNSGEAAEPLGDQLPPGVMETQSAGGHGGGPFVRVTTDKGSLIGFQYTMGNWAGSDCLRDLQPIYADFGSKRLKIAGNNPQEIVAKPGYVVAKVIAKADKTDVAGIYGRRGMNLDAFGLVVKPNDE